MENWWGKFIFTNNFLEKKIGNFRESHPNQSISIEKLSFTKQPFLWKAVQLGSSWNGVCEAGRGTLGRRCFHWNTSTELTRITTLNFAL